MRTPLRNGYAIGEADVRVKRMGFTGRRRIDFFPEGQVQPISTRDGSPVVLVIASVMRDPRGLGFVGAVLDRRPGCSSLSIALSTSKGAGKLDGC